MARTRRIAVALALGLGLAVAAWPQEGLAGPPEIDWQSFVEELESTGGDEDWRVGEMMC